MSPRPRVGTYRWCEEYGATLTWKEKLGMVAQLVRLQVREALERGPWSKASMGRLHARCDLKALTIPDTAMAKEATAYAQQICKPTVYQHCLRTYFFGGLLAQSQGLAVDLELLFVGSILHDLGISPGFIEGATRCCFATLGAREAAAFVSARGWDGERTRRVYEAVSLHFNAHIDHRLEGAEARFVGEGAQLDVLGSRAQRVPRALLLTVGKQHPRAGFREEIIHSNAIAHPPDSRPGFLTPFGFGTLVRRNPLERLG